MTNPSPTLESRFLACLRTHAPTGRLVAGFSGGRDSTVLLHLLAHCCPDRDCLALHVDHGLHPRSGEWAEHCRATAAGLGVSFRLARALITPGPGDSVEALAREARQAAFADCLGPGDTLLAAHHADDQLETVLHRLLRGAGSRGLAGIPRRRSLGEGQLLRPLLDVDGEVIREYAQAHDLSWLEDPSNRDTRFDRNWLRHQVLPRIRARWPGAAQRAARAADNLAEDAALLGEIAAADRARLGDARRLELAGLAELSSLRRRNLLRHWLAESMTYPPSRDLLARIEREVVAAGPDAQPELAAGEWLLRRQGGRLRLEPQPVATDAPPPGPFTWADPRHPLSLPENGRLTLESPAPEGGDNVRLPAPVTVRYRQAGDVFHDGRHHRRLKEWMRLAEIPVQMRDRVPLLLDGERIFAVGETVVDPRYIAADSGEVGDIVGRLRWQRPPV